MFLARRKGTEQPQGSGHERLQGGLLGPHWCSTYTGAVPALEQGTPRQVWEAAGRRWLPWFTLAAGKELNCC